MLNGDLIIPENQFCISLNNASLIQRVFSSKSNALALFLFEHEKLFKKKKKNKLNHLPESGL